jgi:asparagine synthase (glutamine-hydrolysing)
VSRWLAGTFDPRGRLNPERLTRAASRSEATIVELGPLRLAYGGSRPDAEEPWCLLDGYLDNAADLGAALDISDNRSPERLIAAGWRRWGPGVLGRLRGDFVVVIWDARRGEGLLARDQLGARSLFLHGSVEGLCFAGEVRDLLALLPTRPAPDPVGLAHWLAMSDRPGGATLFEGIRRLDPATALLLDRDGVREQVYWTPRFTDLLTGAEEDIVAEIRVALDRAVGRRLDPDRPTGVLMSGGLDSASVAAVAAAQAPDAVLAYAGVFPEHPAVDEADLVDELREALRLGGVTAEVRPGGLLASAVDAAHRWSMPLVGWGDFWVLPLLRAAAADGVRVVLGGDGGDELFGARSHLLADRLRSGHPLQAMRLAWELPGAGYGPPKREILAMLGNVAVTGALPYGLHRLLHGPFAGRGVPRWLRGQTRRDLVQSSDPLAWKRLDGPRWWADIAHGLTRGIEQTGVFEQQRRTAATAGLDARHPLLDLDLVELGMRQPPLASFHRYLNRPVLRAGMAGLVPDAVRLRPQKILFDSLLVDSLAGPDGAAVRQLLADPQAELGAYVDLPAMRRDLLDSDRRRHEQPFRWMWQVWRLCTAECWLRSQCPTGRPHGEGLRPSAPRVTLKRVASAVSEETSYVFPP